MLLSPAKMHLLLEYGAAGSVWAASFLSSACTSTDVLITPSQQH